MADETMHRHVCTYECDDVSMPGSSDEQGKVTTTHDMEHAHADGDKAHHHLTSDESGQDNPNPEPNPKPEQKKSGVWWDGQEIIGD